MEITRIKEKKSLHTFKDSTNLRSSIPLMKLLPSRASLRFKLQTKGTICNLLQRRNIGKNHPAK